MLPWPRVHLLAAAEAERAFRDLAIDTSRRIDPFAALDASGVLVLRRPLDRLAGMYLPGDAMRGGRPGVLVNVQHPLSKQRYTAAHELAHHRRDREAVLDEETEWVARGEAPTSDRERIAEAFAAWFLMPRRLVTQLLTKLTTSPGGLDTVGAYLLSLDLGTSYAATVHHLVDLHVLTAVRRDELLRTSPQVIKRALGAAQVMRDSRRDVWLVRPQEPPLELAVQEGDAVVVEVPEAPSSGFIWQPAILPQGVALIRDEYRGPADDHALGGRGIHRFLFRVDLPGQRALRLEMRRPWQHGAAPTDVRQLDIAAAPKPAPGIVEPHALLPATA